jgi:hypothetical protein
MDPAQFTYPLSIPLPLSNPHDPRLLELPPEWEMPLHHVDSYIDTLLDTHQGSRFIPVGTKLYHGSLNPALDFNHLLDHITFFGIDVVISLWYILELQSDSDRNELKPGTLYEFVVTRPIPVEIIPNLYDHPTETERCVDEPIGCIHPQISFHGDVLSDPPYDLSIEFTLNLNKDAGHGQFKEYMVLQKVYTVDTRILLEHRDKPFSVFNPIQAITSVAYTGRRTSRKIRTLRRKKIRKHSRKN